MPLSRLLFGTLMVIAGLAVAYVIASLRFEYVLAILLAVIVFIVVFARAEAGLYLVLFSMLLSPEMTVGARELAEMRRGVAFRIEDVLLIVILLSWLAKMAANKELGVVVKTPLNRPIAAYVVVTCVATLLGYATGSVKTATGFLYLLKYVEYFIVYYLTANYLRDRDQAWRLVGTAFVTAAIVSVIGIAQIPTGQRISAPFEGEVGEPNTFGGYLLLMMALAAGLALETRHIRTRVVGWALCLLLLIPFIFTLSRASYLGLIPMVGVLALLSSRRWLTGSLLALVVAISPLLLPAVRPLVPAAIVHRVTETFQPQTGQPQVRLGRVGFDPSTSERLISMRAALRGWLQRPLLGWGVTGFAFMDAQYARTLVETGIVGLAAFVWLLGAVIRSGLAAFRSLDGEDRGIALGFVAGTAGLLAHAVGSNTFIIIRIMEPFWFFAAVVILLPTLRTGAVARPAPPARALRSPA